MKAKVKKDVLSSVHGTLQHKPFNPEIVKLRLKNIIDRSEINALERIKYVAEHDQLTGLYNRK